MRVSCRRMNRCPAPTSHLTTQANASHRAEDSMQHVEQPVLPGILRGDIQQQAIVVRPAPQDGAAEVQHRHLEQAELHQDQQVQDPPGAAVAIGKRVDGFELVVRRDHADERIDRLLLMNEALPVGQLLAQQRLALRRRVDHLAGGLVGQRGSGSPPDLNRNVLDL